MNRLRAAASAVASLSLTACSTTISPTHGPPDLSADRLSHELLDRVQRNFVDGKGRVDYTGLKAQPDALNRYYGLIAVYSPDSHPGHFPTADDRLAYWINAYNAAVLTTVITYYPITGVSDVSGPPLVSLVSDKSGFFYFQKLVFGGDKINLYNLEHEVIRERFADPRIHFAINCASLGCPRLPDRAFTPADLQQELEREARRFLNGDRNLRVDDPERAIHLSSILQWYEEDFLGWYRDTHPEITDPDLLDYARLYLVEEKRDALARAEAAGYEVRFVPYDWRLNDQAAQY